MQSIPRLFDFALLADAAYIKFDGAAQWAILDTIINRARDQSRVPEVLARETFHPGVGGWQIVGYDDSQNTSSGFAGTLFRSNVGQYVLALRGTEDAPDYKADFMEIGFIGMALSQSVSMVNWVLRLQAAASATNVMQFDLRTSTSNSAPAMGSTAVGSPMGQPGAWFWIEPRTDGQGLGTLPAGTRIDVTGHSLGGHLAGLMTRLFPTLVNEAIVFNAPGYDPATAGAVASATSGTILGPILNRLLKNARANADSRTADC